MKKTVVSFFLLVTVAAFANDPDPVSEKVQSSFKKEFPGASLISWNETGDYLKAVFLYAGYRSEAYFTKEGELEGSARNIFFNQLPLAVTKAVEKRFTNADVLEVSEITTASGTRYLIRLEDESKKGYRVQYDAGGNNIGFERAKK